MMTASVVLAEDQWETTIEKVDGTWRSIMYIDGTLTTFSSQADIDTTFGELERRSDRKIKLSEVDGDEWHVICRGSGSGCRDEARAAAEYNLKMALLR
jgi:hypothetical protein